DQLCFLFFFQAEDGIRDGHVTGVQTCALPIYFDLAFSASWDYAPHRRDLERNPSLRRKPGRSPGRFFQAVLCRATASRSALRWRSEERRVGKGWRVRGARSERKREEDTHVCGW